MKSFKFFRENREYDYDEYNITYKDAFTGMPILISGRGVGKSLIFEKIYQNLRYARSQEKQQQILYQQELGVKLINDRMNQFYFPVDTI